MRVAFVAIETTRQEEASGTRRLERVARLLADRGHDVTIFCSQWWDDYDDEMVVDGVRYRAVTLGRAPSSFFARLPVLLGRYRPDVIHTRPVPPKQVIAAVAGSKLGRAPLAVEWYGNENVDESERGTRWAASKSNRVITPSEFVRTSVRELGGTDGNTCVIPESIDFSEIEAAEPAEEVDVVYAHPLDESANVDDLLLGLAELRERDWSATIIGTGPLREEYETEVQKLRIDDRVEFVGACDRQKRLSIYRGAHAFVQTAYREVFATELLWALACGCIGIVEYQAESSAHELIENYDRSYRVTDPQELADAIVDAGEFEQLTRDDDWLEYDHDRIIEQYLAEYREIQAEFGSL
jgi:glycosyltransferase involved in cell wall biosynthesis